MKIRPLVGVALVVGMVALGGCSGTSGSSTPEKLQFVLSGDAAQGGAYQKLADKYEEETGIEIEIVDVPYADLVTKLRNGAQAGDLPALARASVVDPVWSSSLLDLSDVAEASSVIPELRVTDSTDGDKVKALPSDLTAVGLFLNTSLWDEAGVTYPGPDEIWSWDQYKAALTEVQAKTGARYGLVMDSSAHRLRSFMYEFGSKGVEEAADGSFSVNDATGTALKYLKDEIVDDSFSPKSVFLSNDDPSALFKSGQVAAYYSGVWQVTDFAKNITAFDWTSVPTPAQPVQATNLGANWLVAFDGTGVEKEAKEFISWLYEPENYAELCSIAGFLPATQNVTVEYPERGDAFDVYNAEVAASDAVSAVQAAQAIEWGFEGRILENEPISTEVRAYLAGEQDLDTTLKNLVLKTEQQVGK